MRVPSWLCSLVALLTPTHSRRTPRRPAFPPRLEALEDRCLLSTTNNEFPLPTPNSQPNTIVAGPDGNVWFMEINRNTLGRITPAGVITEVPRPPEVEAGNNSFLFGPDGNIWLGTRTHIAEVTPQGALLHNYVIPSALPGNSSGGVRIGAIGPDGNIWYTEPYVNDLIGRLTPDGVIKEFPIPGDAFGDYGAAEIINELDGTGRPDGNLWFDATDNNVNYVGRSDSSGVIQLFAVPLAGARGLTSGPDGNLWMTATTNGSSNEPLRVILRVNEQGQLTGQFTIPTPNSGAYGMTVGSDGALWFTEYDPNQIGRITTDGNITEIPITNHHGESHLEHDHHRPGREHLVQRVVLQQHRRGGAEPTGEHLHQRGLVAEFATVRPSRDLHGHGEQYQRRSGAGWERGVLRRRHRPGPRHARQQ
jgi:streptogramin lyase